MVSSARITSSSSHYRLWHTGKRVRGCITNTDIAVFGIVKQGDAEVPGLTNNVLPTHATKIP